MGQRNLFFDTAWWDTADQVALFALIPPGQILFASDTPYGRPVAAASVVLRAALWAGLTAEQRAAIVYATALAESRFGPVPDDIGALVDRHLESNRQRDIAAIARLMTFANLTANTVRVLTPTHDARATPHRLRR